MQLSKRYVSYSKANDRQSSEENITIINENMRNDIFKARIERNRKRQVEKENLNGSAR